MPLVRAHVGDEIGLAVVGLHLAAQATQRDDLRGRYRELAERLFHGTYGRTFEAGDGI